MRVAISGASGFIGRELATSLTSDGHHVLRIVRSNASDLDTVQLDAERGVVEPQRLEGLDAVVHLAGEPIASHRWSNDQKRRIRESRTRGTTQLVDALKSLSAPPRVLLSASAIGYYGDRGQEVLDETSAPGEGFLADVCTEWEARTKPASDAGIRVVTLRTGLVLGPGGGSMAKMLPIFKFGLGGRMGNGEQIWSWISLRDHVAAMRFLMHSDVRGACNLTAPAPVSNEAFTKVLAGALHRPALFPVPAFGPRLLLGRELADNLLFTSADVRPQRLLGAGFDFADPTLEQAFRSLLNPNQESHQ